MAAAPSPDHYWWKPFEKARILLGLAAFVLLALYVNKEKGPLWPGMLISGVGEALQWWAAGHLRKNVALSISGPYAYVRNPMYLGRFLVGLGFATTTCSPFVLIIYVVVFVAYAHARVQREEGRLQKLLGDPYLRYCENVPRWRPRLMPWDLAEPRAISWELVQTNHQHRVTIALVIAYLLLWVRMNYISWHL